LGDKLIYSAFLKPKVYATFFNINSMDLLIVREKELAAVKINPTDVEIIANELEVPILNFD
jgi:hypothetical protein